MTEELPFCECGECGLRVTKKGNRFIHNHHRKGKHNSPEHNEAMSQAQLGVTHTSAAHLAADEAKRGVPKSPEHCAAMSAAKLGIPHTSPAQLAADEAKRGGNDLVDHHYIYDHSDLFLNTVKMARSDHQKLHLLLRRLGYIIPHINESQNL